MITFLLGHIVDRKHDLMTSCVTNKNNHSTLSPLQNKYFEPVLCSNRNTKGEEKGGGLIKQTEIK